VCAAFLLVGLFVGLVFSFILSNLSPPVKRSERERKKKKRMATTEAIKQIKQKANQAENKEQRSNNISISKKSKRDIQTYIFFTKIITYF